jgi:hypothetical protein
MYIYTCKLHSVLATSAAAAAPVKTIHTHTCKRTHYYGHTSVNTIHTLTYKHTITRPWLAYPLRGVEV